MALVVVFAPLAMAAGKPAVAADLEPPTALTRQGLASSFANLAFPVLCERWVDVPDMPHAVT